MLNIFRIISIAVIEADWLIALKDKSYLLFLSNGWLNTDSEVIDTNVHRGILFSRFNI